MRLKTPGRTVTEADIVNFAGVSGDFYSLYIDEEYARNTSFGTRIAHGLLTLSIISGLWSKIGIFEEGALIAFYGIDHLRFTKPVKPGDTIYAEMTVTEKTPKPPGKGIVKIHHEVKNHKNETVLVFDALLLVKARKEL
jgi:3-hydroxybutyryl-CoA dehydratase